MNARSLLLTVEILAAVPFTGRLLARAPKLGPPGPEPPLVVPAGTRLPPARLQTLGIPIDLNRASAAELASLDGIGPRLAARIVAARPFASVDDLARVRGIGRKRVAALRPRLRVTHVSDGASRDLATPVRLDAPKGDGV